MDEALRISDVFVTKFPNTLESFLGDWNNSFRVVAFNLLRKWYLQNYKKILQKLKCMWKNWRIHKKKDICLFIEQFFCPVFSNCLALFLCKRNVLKIFHVTDFVFRFISHWKVFKIVTDFYFWLALTDPKTPKNDLKITSHFVQ